MTSMIERVARAIYENVSAGADDMESCIIAARKVVAEMREPTDAMMDAINEHAGSIAPEYAYLDAIDAALVEQHP